MDVLTCSADGCKALATEALVIRGNIGHTHDCFSCAAELREFCDVIRSNPVLPDGSCPEAICTGNRAVWHGTPTPLEA